MSTWLLVLLLVLAFMCGVHFGVHVIGGWRQMRADLLRIDRKHAAVKAQMREMDEETP